MFTWVAVEEKQVLILNYFKYDSSITAWKEDVLLLLEGQTVNLAAPKKLYSKDLYRQWYTLFQIKTFEMVYEDKHTIGDSVENGMMTARWRMFQFHHQIPEVQQKGITPCPKCVCGLMLNEQYVNLLGWL